MVDLMGQYNKIKNQIDKNIINTIESGKLINGPIVKEFSEPQPTISQTTTAIIIPKRAIASAESLFQAQN